MTDAAYIAARLSVAMPRAVRLRFALYQANLHALKEAGLDAGTAHKAAAVATQTTRLSSTKDLDPELQQVLKRWLEGVSNEHIAQLAAIWDKQSAKS